MSRHIKGPAKRTFEANVGRHSPPRPHKVFRPSSSSPRTAIENSPRHSWNTGRKERSSSPSFIDLTNDPDILSGQEAEVERFRRLKRQEEADAELARKLQFDNSSSPTPGPSSRPDPDSSPSGLFAADPPFTPNQLMPGSFDDDTDAIFGNDNFGDDMFSDGMFDDPITSFTLTPSAMPYSSNSAQTQGGGGSSYEMLPPTERVRQAALGRQEQQFGNSGMFVSDGLFSPLLQSTNGFLPQRPGSLINGSANLMQPLPSFQSSYPQYNSGGSLRDIINRTAGHDYTNGVDGIGNPLDQRIIALMGDHGHSPSQEEGIERLLANLHAEADFKDEDGVADPESLAYPLYKHQRRALRWMTQAEEDDHKKGGILADEMGLGKTISALALIVSRRAKPREDETSVRVSIYKRQN